MSNRELVTTDFLMRNFGFFYDMQTVHYNYDMGYRVFDGYAGRDVKTILSPGCFDYQLIDFANHFRELFVADFGRKYELVEIVTMLTRSLRKISDSGTVIRNPKFDARGDVIAGTLVVRNRQTGKLRRVPDGWVCTPCAPEMQLRGTLNFIQNASKNALLRNALGRRYGA